MEEDVEGDDDFVVIKASGSQGSRRCTGASLNSPTQDALCRGIVNCARVKRATLGNLNGNDWDDAIGKCFTEAMGHEVGVDWTPLPNDSVIIQNAGNDELSDTLCTILSWLVLAQQYNARVRVTIVAFLNEANKDLNPLIDAEVHLVNEVLNGTIDNIASPSGAVNLNNLANFARATANQVANSSWTKWACVGGAATAGALALGYTGGTAAPLVGPSLGAVATATGLSVEAAGVVASTAGGPWISYLFGVAGASLASQRTLRRMAGVQEFEFIKIPRDELLEEFRCSDIDCSSTSSPTPEIHTFVTRTDATDLMAGTDQENQLVVELPLCPVDSTNHRGLRLTLVVSGWIRNGPGEFVSNWNWMKLSESTKHQLRSTDVLSLRWSLDVLHDLGSLFERMLKNEIASQFIGALARQTALRAVLSALAWPAAIVKLTEVIDNTWSITKAHADKVGVILADVIAARVYGAAPVTLVGYAWGARVVFTCLLHLARLAKSHDNPSLLNLVEDCYMCGAPVRVDADEWREVRTVVSGRFVNGFSSRDWILSFCYRNEPSSYLSPNTRVAGLDGAQVADVEDIDFSPYIGSSTEYGTSMEVLWSRMNQTM